MMLTHRSFLWRQRAWLKLLVISYVFRRLCSPRSLEPLNRTSNFTITVPH